METFGHTFRFGAINIDITGNFNTIALFNILKHFLPVECFFWFFQRINKFYRPALAKA